MEMLDRILSHNKFETVEDISRKVRNKRYNILNKEKRVVFDIPPYYMRWNKVDIFLSKFREHIVPKLIDMKMQLVYLEDENILVVDKLKEK